jgi:diguanylate cyclase (GGDEF)-like protein
MNRTLRVLIVEDSQDDAELLVIELELGGYKPLWQRVDTPATLDVVLDTQAWDIIIADYSMPKFTALEALQLLQDKGLDLPFIIVSGTIGEETAIGAMKAGAHDYLLKENLARLVPAIERELREAQVRHESRQAREKLQYLAFFDYLTGLPNRSWFLDRLQECLIRYQEEPHRLFAVLLLTLDRYQMVKYSLGHELSNQLLVSAAHRLENCTRRNDIVARVESDEFAVLLTEIQDPSETLEIAQKIHQVLKLPFNLDGPVVTTNASVGIVLGNSGYTQAEAFIQAADTAMHDAKVRGTSCTTIFDREMQKRAINRLQLETDLQQAIRYQKLYLNYQPIVSLSNAQIVGFEALVRWRHPQKGPISPSQFVPIAEATGLIIQLGEWAIEDSCKRLCRWQEQFAQAAAFSIGVNIAGSHLVDPDLLAKIDKFLNDFQLSGSCLKLEITETILMENASEAMTVLKQLKERNIQICIDDFGTGYSSLSYLRHLPIDILKIDRSFISGMAVDQKDLDIVKAILTLAQTLGLEVIAEGVETEEQLALLRVLGCHYGQGFLFSRPLSPEAVMTLLNSVPMLQLR